MEGNISPKGNDGDKKTTGVIYDMRMVEHRCLWDDGYPEKPDRFTAIIQRCNELGLFERCVSLPPRFATEDELKRIHTKEHIDKLQAICESGISKEKGVDLDKLEYEASLYDYVYFHPSTYDLSLLATGCTIDLVNAVLNEELKNGMAIIRPPGHHAMKSEFCGYCYFNNVAIAAKAALDSGKANKILIVDFDVHHGQATQQAFYNDDRVLYFSTHRFDHGEFWPNLEESNFNFIGAGDGVGYNINIPLNKAGMGNSEFISVWHNILIPVAYQFNPDLIIVSAGYDAAVGCFEGEMDVTPQCYPHLIRPLMGLANGKVAVILEGGYCLQSLAEGAALTLRTLLGDPCPMIDPLTQPDQILVDSVLNSAYMLQSQWKHLSKVRFVKEVEASQVDNHHIPLVKFECHEPKLTIHPTRDCYPIQSDELKRAIKERLDNLTRFTSLAKATTQVCLVNPNSINFDIDSERNSRRILHLEKQELSEGLLNHRYLEQVNGGKLDQDSVASVIEAVAAVALGKAQSALVVTSCSGILSSIVTKYAREEFKLQRILHLDWTVQDETGAKAVFEDDPGVLGVSILNNDTDFLDSKNNPFINDNDDGGITVKIPFNPKLMGDAEYLAAFTKIILPIAYQFNPELLIVSGRFGEVHGQENEFEDIKITAEFYAHVTHLLSSLANGKLVFVLEDTLISAEAVGLVIKALLGNPLPKIKSDMSVYFALGEAILHVWRNYLQELQQGALRVAILPEAQPIIYSASGTTRAHISVQNSTEVWINGRTTLNNEKTTAPATTW
ncbi:unnamed protein product [Allacma fusca]|uniref:Histone deacetylase domain-containing protein n=1 Tax=Allacma fusca TaxID=39272 RepID=A0A8J2LH77_9HEXA|nr:unnamed protein product [Allacma fusca]